MNSQPKPSTPLLKGVSQFEVDFVIPRVGIDLPMGIDPFLLFKSRDAQLSQLHSSILEAFNLGINFVRDRKSDVIQKLFDFPEVSEIGFGYTKKSKRGAGVGEFLSQLIIETLSDSPALLERGVKHIEEMQLVSVGIGPDRISDITANLIKRFLIEYTQKQCELWGIELSAGVPIEHVFDPENSVWYDGYFDLPVSPFDASPILLVPRRIVRTLPWINYDDYFRTEFSTYLRAKRVRGKLGRKRRPDSHAELRKEKVVAITRAEVERVDRYVSKKESTAIQAQPTQAYLDSRGTCPESDSLRERLRHLDPGEETAADYQRLVLEILNFLFNPELIDGELEVRTIDGTERRDILFTNDSDQSFWSYLRTEHSSILLMFETKNTKKVDNTYLNQTAVYLGDRLGRLGFIVSRNPTAPAQEKKALSIYNDSNPRKIILMISDSDIETMLDMKCQGSDPMRHVQKVYRSFRTRAQ